MLMAWGSFSTFPGSRHPGTSPSERIGCATSRPFAIPIGARAACCCAPLLAGTRHLPALSLQDAEQGGLEPAGHEAGSGIEAMPVLHKHSIHAMRRILVIGISGAGKNTFTRKLAAKTGLPVIHLDTEFWKPGWGETERAEWRAKVAGRGLDHGRQLWLLARSAAAAGGCRAADCLSKGQSSDAG